MNTEEKMRAGAQKMIQGLQALLDPVSDVLSDAKAQESAKNTSDEDKAKIKAAFEGNKGIIAEMNRAQKELNSLAEKFNTTVKR